MLDIRRIKQNRDEVVEALEKRAGDFPIDEVLEVDKKRREIIQEVEGKKAEQNKLSKKVPEMQKKGEDASKLIKELRGLSDEISELDKFVKEKDAKIKEILLEIPNTPDERVPIGEDDTENKLIRTWGDFPEFSYEPKAHWDLGTENKILDFERAGKISGPRFSIFRNEGAQLQRALINFMVDLHREEHGYQEMWMPTLVNQHSMTGTGQLPKFKEDMYHCEKDDYYLAPTAEVPLTNYFGGEILSHEELPIHFVGYTACFRREAGSHGRDTRGLIRNHQFDKVELVKFVKPEDSFDELEKLTSHAEKVLQKLEIPYQVVLLCSGDLGFSSTMTYDIEVWMPSYDNYVEISSCSNFLDYQARRANIRFRNEDGKVEFLHTLNGSGIAVGRCFAALIENYQNEDGSITIPEVLRPFMAGKEKIGG